MTPEKEKIDKYKVEKVYFEPITGYKHPILASGATPIGSADRAPDKIDNTSSYERVKFDFTIGAPRQIINSHFTPIGSDLRLVD
jgi:hypothetical protein